MCFKTRRALVLLASALVISCGLKTGESVPPPLSPSFKGESYSCVGLIPENLDAYFKGKLDVPQIRSFIGCLQRAFLAFSQLTRGRNEGVYTPEELRNFIQRNFLRDKYTVSDRLMNEFMVIKQVLVGGTHDRVSRGELYALVAVLDDVRDEAIRLKPHLPLINPDLAPQMIAESKDKNLADRLRRANEALGATIRTFASRLERTRVDYSLDHLKVFLDEFRDFVHWDEHFKDAAPTAAWVKLLRSFKLATVAPYDGGLIHPDDWAPLFTGMWRFAQQYKIPMISPSSTNPEVTAKRDFVFRVCFIDPVQGPIMARFAAEDLKVKKVAILRDIKSDYSIGLSKFFTEKFRALGGEVVASLDYSSNDPDFKAQLTQVRAAEPGALYVPGYYNDLGPIARQARELGITVPLLGGDGWDSPKLFELAAGALEGSYFSNHYSAESPNPATRKFVVDYRAKYGIPSDGLAAAGYDAAGILLRAIESAKDLTPKSIRAELTKTRDYPGATGTISINSERSADKDVFVVRVTGDTYKFVKMFPKDPAPRQPAGVNP